MASLANLEMNRTWQNSTAGKLAQKEYYAQRMIREPIHYAPTPAAGPRFGRHGCRTPGSRSFGTWTPGPTMAAMNCGA